MGVSEAKGTTGKTCTSEDLIKSSELISFISEVCVTFCEHRDTRVNRPAGEWLE